jgi:hypothetical protein
LERLALDAVADRLFGILRHEGFEFCLGLLVFEMRLPGSREDRGELRPGIGGRHVDNAHRFKPRFWRFDPEQLRLLATLDAAPELALGGDDQVLIERIGMGEDLHPLAAPGNHRQHRGSGRYHPHIVLQLRHVFFRGRFRRERPRPHELGFEHRIAALDPAIQSRPHPTQRWMTDLLLDVGDHLHGIGLIPAAIEILSSKPELNEQIAG